MSLDKWLGKFHAGDCEELAKLLPDSSIDLIFTSPPYADLRAYSRIDPDAYVDWFLPKARQFLRILKSTGSFVLNINDRIVNGERHLYVYELVIALKKQLGFKFIERYFWYKPNAIPGRKGPRTKDSTEYIFWFAKDEPYFDLEAVKVPARMSPEERAAEIRKPSALYRKNTKSGHGRVRLNSTRDMVDPGNVIVAPIGRGSDEVTLPHTAIMPTEVTAFAIRAGSPPGGVVLDPFAGSGTTCLVAEQLGRQWIGMDISPEFCDLASKRLARVRNQLSFDFVAASADGLEG